MPRLHVLNSRPRPGSLGRAARLGPVALAVAVLLAACGDDGDESVSEADDVEGCEPGEISGGDNPGDALELPEDPRAALDEAIAKTKSLTSAVTSIEISVEAPQGTSLVDMQTAFDDGGVMRAVAEQDINDDSATVVFCSDGETGWLHLNYADVAEALPADARWVDGPTEEMFEAGLIRDPKTTWDVFAILRGMTEIEDAGTEHISDVQVRRIKGNIDYQTALAASSEEEALAMSMAVTAGDDPDINAEAGLDADGVLRWLLLDVQSKAMTLEDAESGEGTEVPVKVRYEITVRDANPDITAPSQPSADQTVRLADVPEVERMLRGQSEV